jgi:hypothetical protein
MGRTLALLSLILAALSWARTGQAQSRFVAVDSGARMRVTGCLPDCGTQLRGSLLQLEGDSMILAEVDDTIAVSLSDVTRLEVGTRHRFDGKKALYWGTGTAVVVGLLAVGNGGAPSGEVVGAAAFWGLSAAIFAGGGKRALKTGFVGALLAAPAVGLLAVATYQPCTGWCIMAPSSEGEAFMLGALVGGGVGFLIGGAIGAFTGGESWSEVGGQGVRLSITPTADGGVAVGGTVRF